MRWFFGTVLSLLVALGIYVSSAVVSLNGLVEAARSGDGAGVFARTDMVRVRRSLVDQIVSSYLKQLGQDRPVKPLERMAANTYGASVADAMIAKMLTEENLTAILNKGSINSSAPIANMQHLTEIDTSQVLATLKRITPVKPVEFRVHFGETESAGSISIHFEGNGWKLSGIQLPAPVVRVLAQGLVHSKGRNG